MGRTECRVERSTEGLRGWLDTLHGGVFIDADPQVQLALLPCTLEDRLWSIGVGVGGNAVNRGRDQMGVRVLSISL